MKRRRKYEERNTALTQSGSGDSYGSGIPPKRGKIKSIYDVNISNPQNTGKPPKSL